MNYRSLPDLNRDARKLAHELPNRIDLVVGIPRSGVLAAHLLCLSLDAPMTDVDGLWEGDVRQPSRRSDGDPSLDDVETALVVDDTIYAGREMEETKRRFRERDFPFDVEYAAMYAAPQGREHVDYWADVVRTPRVFEWKLLHHPMLESSCVALDGVLCREPTPAETADEGRYREFVETVAPRAVPTERVGWVVAARPETYREETAAWLDERGVEYENLVTMGGSAAEARTPRGDPVEFKSAAYRSADASLFVEGSMASARTICERSRKPVYCYGESEMVAPGRIARTYQKTTSYLSEFADDPLSFSRKAGGYALDRVGLS